jgi:hypothetical protein
MAGLRQAQGFHRSTMTVPEDLRWLLAGEKLHPQLLQIFQLPVPGVAKRFVIDHPFGRGGHGLRFELPAIEVMTTPLRLQRESDMPDLREASYRGFATFNAGRTP